jgi:NADH-quinone oxidoreductase subunit J
MTFSAAGTTTLIFCGFVAVTIGGALIAALSRQMVRSVCGLAVSSLGLAGLYYLLASPFLALMHILIYVGAVCVVLMFALMLSEPQEQRRSLRSEALINSVGLLVSGLFSVFLFLLITSTRWVRPAQQSGNTVQDLGRALLTRYGFAFELISVVLLLAILGALVIARSGRGSES